MMMMATKNRLPCAMMVTAGCLLLGCTTGSRHPWVEDGQRMGMIRKVKAPFGMEWHYVSHDQQLVRVEKRDRAGEMLPGAAVKTFVYDADGRVTEEHYSDAQGRAAATEEGYVIKTYADSLNEGGDRIKIQGFLNGKRRPVCTTNGYAFVRTIHDGDTAQVREIHLEDTRHGPAAGVWEEVGGVARVKYTTVKGVGDVRCGVYYDGKGAVVHRKVVKGTCFYSYTY